MAVTAHMYTKLFDSMAKKLVNLTATDALKCMLGTAAGTPNYDTHQFVSEVKAAGFTEHAATGTYVAGGLTLTYGSATRWAIAGHVYTLDADDVLWAGSTLTAVTHALFYDSTPGTDATNPVLCLWDLGGAQTSSAGDFKLTLNALGLLTFTGPG